MDNRDRREYREQREYRDRKPNKKNGISPINIALIVVLILLIAFLATKIVSYSRKADPIDEPKQVTEGTGEENKDEGEDDGGFFGFKKKEEEKKEEVDPIKLKKGFNHNNEADSYAYDAKTISKFIRPKNSPGFVENKDHKKIAFLTFDDGPNHEITPQILDTLKEEGVHATFFVVGKDVNEENKDVLEREIAEGHAIALHSFYHEYEDLYPGRDANPDQIKKEAEMSQQALKDVLGSDFNTAVWRYPGGHMSWGNTEPADQALESIGIHWVDWNSLIGDAEPKNVRPTTVEGLVEYANTSKQYFFEQDITVILCHDAANKQLTADAMSSLIKNFKDQGYEFGILE
ncbi:MAG: polysaccharide deacetylase family protein [Finegoldia sp.]|nr:polysaccharide deacetylase family protein [Finegoldia sp.]